MLRSAIRKLLSSGTRTELDIVAMDPRSVMMVLKGQADEVWSDITIEARLRKQYPSINWDQTTHQWMRLTDRVICWIYPLAYLELCRELSNESILVNLQSHAAFMCAEGMVHQVQLAEDAWLQVQFDQSGFLQRLDHVSAPSNGNEDVHSHEDLESYLNHPQSFMTTLDQETQARTTFKLGNLNSWLRMGAIALVLLLAVLSMLRWIGSDGLEQVIQDSRKIDKLDKEITSLCEQNIELRSNLQLHLNRESHRVVVAMNQLLQNRNDKLHFTEADLRHTGGQPVIALVGEASSEKELGDFLTLARGQKFQLERLKQNDTSKGIRFEADFTW